MNTMKLVVLVAMAVAAVVAFVWLSDFDRNGQSIDDGEQAAAIEQIPDTGETQSTEDPVSTSDTQQTDTSTYSSTEYPGLEVPLLDVGMTMPMVRALWGEPTRTEEYDEELAAQMGYSAAWYYLDPIRRVQFDDEDLVLDWATAY